MVTSTSTPGSSEMEVICLTISEGEWRSMRRLWMRISKWSQVLNPHHRATFGWCAKEPGGETDGALDAELLVLGSVHKVGADLLEVLDVARGEGDADLVDLGSRGRSIDILVLGDVAHLGIV